MKFTLPLFVQLHHPSDQSAAVHVVRPLFFLWPEERDPVLSRATAKAVGEVRKELERLGSAGQHRELADWTFCPEVEIESCDLQLDLHDRMFRGFFPIVSFRRLNRRIAFCPLVHEVWFEVHRGETIRDRAATVYRQHFRRLRRQREIATPQLEELAKKQQAWVTNVDLEIDAGQELQKQETNLFAILGGAQPFHGGHELQRVGRCLDWRFPDGLHRAFHRNALADRLTELLLADDKRPVLLVGPPQAGKTALVHEVVYRKVSRQISAHQSKGNVWLVSPQRLISGMSYVGQWEDRLLAILGHVREKKHTLYFDDLLGLYRAGASASSRLSVADVLKPHIEQRRVRVLGEMTPEQLRVFRERDRGLADLFHVMHVEETDEPTTLRVLLASLRLLEGRHACRFDLDALPTALDLTRRYVRDAAMPGKAVSFLAGLAIKRPNQDIRREDVLREFHAISGLQVSLLDTRARLRRKEVVEALASEIIGQPHALEALADVAAIAKARLNDPSRPLGAFLFLGPTGVGKTQSAKALARYLFGDASRLVRFDMNEFVTAESAARLAGVFDHPEGLLTSAVRRQPFSVILLDEIEKAHPDVFDLLLQVLGEGRLTDGLGRTADFTNAVIVLTSNLGTRQAAERIGFDRGEAQEAAAYLQAVEDFFRPEFFNRLDRIVPFNRLAREDLARIAEMTLHGVLTREGLVRRRCVLEVAPAAMDWVIEQGYHPVLGARAMKRAVERELVQPLARRLATIAPATPTVLRITRLGDGVAIEAIGLANAVLDPQARRPSWIGDPAVALQRVRTALDNLAERYRKHRPAMAFSAAGISPFQYHFLACEELFKAAREQLRRLRDALDERRGAHRGPSLPSHAAPRRYRRERRVGWSENYSSDQVFAQQDLQEYLEELARQSEDALDESQVEQAVRKLIDHAALLHALAPSEQGWRYERVLVFVRSLSERANTERDRVARGLLRRFRFPALGDDRVRENDDFAAGFGLEVQPVFGFCGREAPSAEATPAGAAGSVAVEADPLLGSLVGVLAEGCNALALIQPEEGTHLFTDAEGRLAPVQVVAWRLEDNESPQQGRDRFLALHRAVEQSSPADDPLRFRPLVRVYGHGYGPVLDLRTGLTAATADADLTAMVLGALPLPVELQEPAASLERGRSDAH